MEYFTKEDTQMPIITLKRCSTSVVKKNVRLGATVKHHLTYARMTKIKKKITTPNVAKYGDVWLETFRQFFLS